MILTQRDSLFIVSYFKQGNTFFQTVQHITVYMTIINKNKQMQVLQNLPNVQ